MNYEQAKEIALRLNNKVNACKEYKLAYHFYDKYNETERYPDNDVVIFKDTGKTVNFSTFILDYNPERTPKSIKF